MYGGGFIFLACPSTGRILLGLRPEHTNFSPLTWFCFGGTWEEGESLIDTATREFFEETKIQKDKYKIVPNLVHKIDNYDNEGNLHHIAIYLATCHSELFPEIDFESKDWKWFKLSDLPHLNLHPFLMDMFISEKTRGWIKQLLLKTSF